MAWRAISTRRSRFACRSPSPRNCAISTRKSAKRGPADGSAAEKQVEQQREHQAQQQAGDDRKIEMDIAAVERDVAGQPSQEWDSQAKEEDQADHQDEAADDDEQLADFGHEFRTCAGGRLPFRVGQLTVVPTKVVDKRRASRHGLRCATNNRQEALMVHARAKLTPFGRLLVVQRVGELGWPVAQAAESMGVSRATAYKWLRRFRSGGLEGLKDSSSRPSHCR